MAGVKRKYESNVSSKPVKKQKSPPPSKPFKSAEIIVDSASDNEIPRGRKTTQKPTTSSTEVSSNGFSIQLSPMRTEPKPTVPRSVPSKRSNYETSANSSTTSTSDDSESDLGSEDQALSAPIKMRQEESESETDSEGSDVDEEDSASDEGLEEIRKQQENLESRTGSATSEPVRPPASYNPPPDFKAASVTSALSSQSHDAFAVDNLQGKQIWHIIAPASVPISLIKEVPIQKVFTGSPILSHKGADYGLFAEANADRDEKVLLVPSHKDDNYRLAGADIAKTLRLQQIVKPPFLSHKPENSATGVGTAPKTHVRAIRQQPEGLTMRYRPFGDESSSEDSDPDAQFKVPPIVSSAKSPKKAKPMAEITTTSPPRQHAKVRKDSSIGKSNRDSLSSSSKDPVKVPRFKVPPIVSLSQSKQNAKPVAESLESLAIKERTKPRADTTTPNPKGDSSSLSMLELAWKSSFGNAPNANGPKPAATRSPATDPKPKETTEEKAKRRGEKKRRKQSKAIGTEDPTKAVNVAQTTPLRKEPGKGALNVDGVQGTPSARPETEQLKSEPKKKKRESEAVHGKEAVAINGVGNAHIKHPEPEQTKTKKRKRKSEATDDV
ncbi:MAG: hypothetical protein Q9181_007001 [Wetmoreana brouardii]